MCPEICCGPSLRRRGSLRKSSHTSKYAPVFGSPRSLQPGLLATISGHILIPFLLAISLTAPACDDRSYREIGASIDVLTKRSDELPGPAIARLRHRLKLPDAIQLATAVQEGCHAMISHDRDFGKIREILVLG